MPRRVLVFKHDDGQPKLGNRCRVRVGVIDRVRVKVRVLTCIYLWVQVCVSEPGRRLGDDARRPGQREGDLVEESP